MERGNKALSDDALVPSNSTLQNTTLTAENSGSPSTNETNTSNNSTSNDTNTSSTSPTVKKEKSSNAGQAVVKSSTESPIPKTQVLSTTPAGSGADTGSVMQSVNYYLGIVIYLLVRNKITALTIKSGIIAKEMTFPKILPRVLGNQFVLS